MQLVPRYRVELVEQDDEHRYTINNDPTFYPGVTGILGCISKPALVPWAAKETALYIAKMIKRIREASRKHTQHNEDRIIETLVRRAKKQPKFIKEKAAKEGTEAHLAFDNLLCGKPCEIDKGIIRSFNLWRKHEKIKIVKGDTRCASIDFGYGGSLDALGMGDDGKLVIFDFKTGKGIWPEHSYQVSAYSQALKETYSLDYLAQGVVVRFDREKEKYERAEVRSIEDSFQAFKAALDLYKAMQYLPYGERKTMRLKKEKNSEATKKTAGV